MNCKTVKIYFYDGTRSYSRLKLYTRFGSIYINLVPPEQTKGRRRRRMRRQREVENSGKENKEERELLED